MPGPVPESYEFPHTNIKLICDKFMYGVPVLKIRPFRRFRISDLKRKHQQYFSRAEFIFKSLCTFILSEGIVDTIEKIYLMKEIEWDTAFAISFPKFIASVETKSLKSIKKLDEISYVTVYNILHK